MENNKLSDQDTRDVLTNIKNDIEVNLLNEIEVLSGKNFKGEVLTSYGDAFGPKEEGMLLISGFNTNSIKIDEIRSTRQESVDLQVDI